MPMAELRKMGIDFASDAPWGTHLCQFYQTKEDLIDILVPFLRAGLENNEFCVLVASEPLSAEEAKEAMREALPTFDQYLKRGQIEVVPHTEFYLKEGVFDSERVCEARIDKYDQALTAGYDGIRVTGNLSWLEKIDWRDLVHYEEETTKKIGKYRMLALCSYPIGKLSALEAMDVLRNHEVSLTKREGKWEAIERLKQKWVEPETGRWTEFYEEIVHGIGDAISLIDPGTYKIVSANRAFLEGVCLTKEDVTGKPCYEIIHNQSTPCGPPSHSCPLDELLKTGKSITSEHVHFDKEGNKRYVEVSVHPVKKGMKIHKCVHVTRDITERKKMEEQIQSLAKFPTENPNPVLRIGSDGTIIYANKSSTPLLASWGCQIGQSVPEEWREWIAAMVNPGLAKEVEVECGDRVFSCILAPIVNEGYLNVYGRDVTEPKRAEEALKESEDRFKTMIDEAADGLLLADIETKKISLGNKSICQMLGYDSVEIKTLGVSDIHPKEDLPRVLEGFEKQIKGENNLVMDAQIKRKDGTVFYADIRSVLMDIKGKKYLLGIFRDITERKKAEDEIRRLKEFNEDIVQKMEDGIMTLDENNRITFLNPKTLAMLGYAKGELEGEPFEIIYCNREEIQAHLNRAKERHPVKFEGTLRTKGGNELVVLNSCTPIFHGNRFDGFLCTLTDITEWKAVEDAYMEKSLRYDLAKGNIYLSDEPEMERAMGAFQDLLKVGYTGMVITRRHPEELREKYPLKKETPVYWLGSEAATGVNALPPELSAIEREIRDFLGRRRVFLLGQLEYLVAQKGFEETLAFVQRLHERVYASGGILLLSLDPAAFLAHHLALLRGESQPLERKEGPSIPLDLHEILKFVQGENREGRKPTPKELTKRFGFSRMTCLTKLKQLKALGLIADEQRGRMKLTWVTEKGKDLL